MILCNLILVSCSLTCSFGHDFIPATCTTASICIRCGEFNVEELGHSLVKATCTTEEYCSRCLEVFGTKLSTNNQHTWLESNCFYPKICDVCGESEGTSNGHNYSEKGVCIDCGTKKEHGNDYGYFSSSELYAMAKHYVEDFVHPNYINNYCNLSDVIIDVADSKLYGNNSYVLLFTANYTKNSKTIKDQTFAVVIEPYTISKYNGKDVYIY